MASPHRRGAVEFLILPGQQAPQMLQRFRQLSAAALAPVLVKHPMPGEAQQGTNRWKHVTQHFIAIFLENDEKMMRTWMESMGFSWDGTQANTYATSCNRSRMIGQGVLIRCIIYLCDCICNIINVIVCGKIKGHYMALRCDPFYQCET